MSLHITLERFEGPLGLLLHLIKQEEMDIFDINIQHITNQYLNYIKAMRRLDLEVAGEFVAMAATLIQIKSRMLLPQYDERGEEIEEDPRRELVQKLLEYQKFQEVAKRLYSRPLVGRDLWLRGERLNLENPEEELSIEQESSLFALISSYRAIVRKARTSIHQVVEALQSISSRIMEIREKLQIGRSVGMGELVTVEGPHESRMNQVLITFLSLLELARMGFVSLFQSENFAEIHIETKRSIDRDVVARADDFAQSEINKEFSRELSGEIADQPTLQVHREELKPLEEPEDSFAATDEEILAEEARLTTLETLSPVSPELTDGETQHDQTS